MQFINYFFTSLISFSGLAIGILLVKIAPEEQEQLKKYMGWMQKLILGAMLAFLALYYYNKEIYLAELLVCFVCLAFVDYKVMDRYKRNMFAYLVFGIFFYLSSKNLDIFLAEAALILLYGLPVAPLMYNAREKNHKKIIFYNSLFLIAANLLYFL